MSKNKPQKIDESELKPNKSIERIHSLDIRRMLHFQ